MTSKLNEFLREKMSMTDIYQPVIIKELLENGGSCTKTELAAALAKYDLSVLDYYRKIVMRWPKKTLSKHEIIKYERRGERFSLVDGIADLDDVVDEVRECEDEIGKWVEDKRNKKKSPEASASVRYKIIKRAQGKCAACGISKSLRAIDIDHIVPQSRADKSGKIVKDGKRIGDWNKWPSSAESSTWLVGNGGSRRHPVFPN